MSTTAERDAAFAIGLSKLAAACRQNLDELTTETYIEALSDQVRPETWQGFVRDSIRSGRYRWLPTISELLTDLGTWRAKNEPRSTALPIRPTGGMWDSPEQEARTVQTVIDNPKRPGESALQYVVRIAELAGLTRRSEAPPAAKVEPVREPGEEG